MNPPALPRNVARELDAVAEATAELVTAARAGDAEGIRRAAQTRGEAIDRLEDPLRKLGQRAGTTTELPAEERAALAESAAQARAELQKLTAEIRKALEELGRDAQAIRSYTASSSPAAVLDRST